MSNFAGKRIIVTGAASGIGHAVAEQLIAQGAEVHSLDRNRPSAAVTRHIDVDLADRSSIDHALTQLDGNYAALLNVAGVPGTAPPNTVFAVNTLAVRHLSENILTRLSPGGSVVVVSSIAGFNWPARLDIIKESLATTSFEEGAQWFRDNPQEGNAYNFSKEAATVFALTMGLVFAESGRRINAVMPGPVQTPILVDFESSMGKDNLDGLRELLGRHANADEIARVILFLASDDASWVNGQTLIVDGGAAGAVATGLVPAPEI